MQKCCVFKNKETNFNLNNFETIKEYEIKNSHENGYRKLIKCIECGSLFLYQEFDWTSNGKTDTYIDLMQVENEEESDEINTKTNYMNFLSNNPTIKITRGNVKFFNVFNKRRITIEPRYYNGKYGKGSVFKNSLCIVFENESKPNVGKLTYTKVKCIDPNLGPDSFNAVITVLYDFSDESLDELNILLDKIYLSPEFEIDVNKYAPFVGSNEKYKYTTVTIDGKTCEVPNNSKFLDRIKEILHFNEEQI